MALKDRIEMTTVNEGSGVLLGCVLAYLIVAGLTFLLLRF